MSQPYPPGPPPPGYYRRRRGGIVWPLILIAAGVIFLLQNLGLVSWQIWGQIGQFWPVILILIGLELFFGGSRRGLLGVALAVCLALAVGAAIAGAAVVHRDSTAAAGPAGAHTLTQDPRGASSAAVTVRYGAGNLDIGALPDTSDQLAQLSYQGSERLVPEANYHVQNGQGQLSYNLHGAAPPHWLPFTTNDSTGQMDLQLNPSMPLTLDIQEGASDGKLDLSQLHVSNLALQTGASHATVVMPRNAGTTNATIKGGAATIDVQVPDGVATQIQYGGGLSTLNVDQNRFPSAGPQTYRSADYDSAQNKLDLTIEAGVATVNVH